MLALAVRQQVMGYWSGLAWRSISVVILLCWLPAAQALSLDQNSASLDSKAQQPQTCAENGREAFTTQAEFVLIGAVVRCNLDAQRVGLRATMILSGTARFAPTPTYIGRRAPAEVNPHLP